MDEVAPETPAQDAWSLLEQATFTVGGDDQLGEIRTKYAAQPGDDPKARQALSDAWDEAIAKVQVQLGTLLKTDTVSFLLGAGASVESGGVLIGSVPLEVERRLLEAGLSGGASPRVRKWLALFYLAARQRASQPDVIPAGRDAILERHARLALGNPGALPANYEHVLSTLHQWEAVLRGGQTHLRIDGGHPTDIDRDDLTLALRHATDALVASCQLPTPERAAGLDKFSTFIRKILTRPLNLKRVNIFTLNYDTLVEQASDAEGVVLVDGFIGSTRRVFRPESYDQDLYFPAQTTEGRVHRLDRVAHLYKLHGSITWKAMDADLSNPYGVEQMPSGGSAPQATLVYPTPAKAAETLGMPYSELFRRFAAAVVRPQSTLIVTGYAFGDDHVNAIIRQALAVPSFTFVVVDPRPDSDFVAGLQEAKDRRVWLMSGKTFGEFGAFVQRVLPDLRDEDVRRQTLATYRALRPVHRHEERNDPGVDDGQ